MLGGLDVDIASATARLVDARGTGAAAERFQQMVTALGGPVDLLTNPGAYLPVAPVTLRVDPLHNGYVQSVDTRSVGLTVVALGGGRIRVEDSVDHAVGLTEVIGPGEYVDQERPLAIVHARNDSEAKTAADALRSACSIGDDRPALRPVVASRITV